MSFLVYVFRVRAGRVPCTCIDDMHRCTCKTVANKLRCISLTPDMLFLPAPTDCTYVYMSENPILRRGLVKKNGHVRDMT